MDYFVLEEDRAAGYTGDISGINKWGLPGVICSACGSTWSGGSIVYPSVDLTPVEALADFKTPRPEPIEEYERLCELVRPLLPPGALLTPGAGFGPTEGTAHGRFGALFMPYSWVLYMRREALEKLQAEGLQGLKGCRTAVRFRQRQPPELLEMELMPVGQLHPDCLPPGLKPPCSRCGRRGFSLPKEPILARATVPVELDLFRLAGFSTLILCTERFVSAYQRLGLDGVTFTPIPTH